MIYPSSMKGPSLNPHHLLAGLHDFAELFGRGFESFQVPGN
jgi:hypothetical protein